MKIYFGITVAGDRSGLVAARKIVDVLRVMGHEVLTAHLLGEDAWWCYAPAFLRQPELEPLARRNSCSIIQAVS
jgi:hypothetical protein